MILTESKLHRNLGLGLTGFIALWSALSEVVSAFQCGAIEPWRFLVRGGDCFNLVYRKSKLAYLRLLLTMYPGCLLADGGCRQHSDRFGLNTVPSTRHHDATDEHE